MEFSYNGKPIKLNPLEEETAGFFAAMAPDSPYLTNENTCKIFTTNFFADFQSVLTKENKKVVKDFAKCDFKKIATHLEQQRMVKKAKTDGEKKATKETKDQLMFQYGFAFVDGHLEKVGNYNMEPPGTFRGRGEHPKMGKLKVRCEAEVSPASEAGPLRRPQGGVVTCNLSAAESRAQRKGGWFSSPPQQTQVISTPQKPTYPNSTHPQPNLT